MRAVREAPLDASIAATCPHEANGPRALVLADDIGVFLSIARSLGRAGIAVDVATCSAEYPGLASRHIDSVHLLPGFLDMPGAWKDALRALCRERGYDLIFATNDSNLDMLATSENALPHARLAIANREALAAFADKASTRVLAREYGVPTADGIEAAAWSDPAPLCESRGFPLVIKPARPFLAGSGEAKRMARIARDQRALQRALADFAGRDIVIEEFFEGDGVGLSVLADRGDILAAWQHRRLAQASETGRSSRRVGEPPDAALLQDVRKLASATVLTGPAMFEFRHDRPSGRHVLIEVNPRYWGSLALALAAGADFPLWHWRLLHGEAVGAAGSPISFPITKTSLTAEFDRISDLPAEGFGWLTRALALAGLMAAALIFPQRFDGWTSDDPAPHRAELRALVSRLWSAVQRRLA
ncbi:ATP-grasp domain-containing protein [Qipengyuania nanhaisediminis]|uniref:carboxylate--amine ligase n=1 Tax=Qipengyuania nanhaisediminis TaxID=604088 RepID=UPI0038B2DDC9